MGKLYLIFTVISTLVRQFVLPNPFECFGESAFMINLIAEPIIHAVAYGIVGLFYISGSDPLFGSIAYLVTYALIVGILWVLSLFSFAWWWILILAVVFVGLVIGVMCLKSKLDDYL
jgi:hypothetical protein